MPPRGSSTIALMRPRRFVVVEEASVLQAGQVGAGADPQAAVASGQERPDAVRGEPLIAIARRPGDEPHAVETHQSRRRADPDVAIRWSARRRWARCRTSRPESARRSARIGRGVYRYRAAQCRPGAHNQRQAAFFFFQHTDLADTIASVAARHYSAAAGVACGDRLRQTTLYITQVTLARLGTCSESAGRPWLSISLIRSRRPATRGEWRW